MIKRMLVWCAALAVCAISVAVAQPRVEEHPELMPRREVTVVYRLNKPDKLSADLPQVSLAETMQVTYTLAGERTRVDFFRWAEAKAPYVSLIYSGMAGRLTTVMSESRTYSEQQVPTTSNPGIFLTSAMHFKRRGKVTIAGLVCNEWLILNSENDQDGRAKVGDTVCVTDDGITLRVAGKNPGDYSLVAVSAQYGTPLEGIFSPPIEFDHPK